MGRLGQILGLPKSLGQVYGLLLSSDAPLSAEDMCVALGVSKGTISVTLRQLGAWKLARTVWVPGDRKDYHVVAEDFTLLARTALDDFFKPRIKTGRVRLDQLQRLLDQEKGDHVLSGEAHAVRSRRLRRLGEMQRRMERVLPLLERWAE